MENAQNLEKVQDVQNANKLANLKNFDLSHVNSINDFSKSLYTALAFLKNNKEIDFNVPKILGSKRLVFSESYKGFLDCLSKNSVSANPNGILGCVKEWQSNSNQLMRMAKGSLDNSIAMANHMLIVISFPGLVGLMILFDSMRHTLRKIEHSKALRLEKQINEHIKMMALSMIEKMEKFNTPKSIVMMDELLKRGYFAGYKVNSEEDEALVYLNTGMLKAFKVIKDNSKSFNEYKVLLEAYFRENPAINTLITDEAVFRSKILSRISTSKSEKDLEAMLESVRYDIIKEYISRVSCIPLDDEINEGKLKRKWWLGEAYFEIQHQLDDELKEKLTNLLESINPAGYIDKEKALEFIKTRIAILNTARSVDRKEPIITELVNPSKEINDRIKEMLDKYGRDEFSIKEIGLLAVSIEKALGWVDYLPEYISESILRFGSYEPFRDISLDDFIKKDGDYVFVSLDEPITDLENQLFKSTGLNLDRMKEALDKDEYMLIADSIRMKNALEMERERGHEIHFEVKP